MTLIDLAGRQPALGVGAEFALDLRAGEPVLGRAARMVAARRQGLAVGGVDLDARRDAGKRRIGSHVHLSGEAPQSRIVVARRLELGERHLAIVQDRRRHVVGRQQRLELRLVARENPVQVEHRLAQEYPQLPDPCGIDLVVLHEIEQRGHHALDRGCGGPQAQRNLLELPAAAEIGGGGLGAPAVRVAVVEAAVARGEKLAGGDEFLLGQHRRHQARQRAAALMEFDRRRSPRRKGAGSLAAGKPERPRHGLAVEAAQPADRGRGAERAEHAGPVPATSTKGRIVDADADPGRHLGAGNHGDQQVAAAEPIAFGDRQRRGHHFRRDMRHGGAVGVAHGHRGDQIAIEHGRTGERQPVAADHGALVGLRQPRRQRHELVGLIAAMTGDRTGERIQQQVLAVFARALRDGVVGQRSRELGQRLCRFCGHSFSPLSKKPRPARRSLVEE